MNYENGRKVLLLVRELHLRGFERIRIAPGMAASGCFWNCRVASADVISAKHGARLIRLWIDINSDDLKPPFYSSADGENMFDWPGASNLTVPELADLFCGKRPLIAKNGQGRDPEYVAWYARMLELTEPDAFPIAYADYALPEDHLTTVGGRTVSIPLPPVGLAPEEETPLREEEGWKQRDGYRIKIESIGDDTYGLKKAKQPEKPRHPQNWATPMYDAKVTMLLVPPIYGWIDFILIGNPYGGFAKISFSNYSDPWTDLMAWMERIASDQLPASVEVDQEGHFALLTALPVENRPEWMELTIDNVSERGIPEKTHRIYWSRVERNQFIREFVRRFRDWRDSDYVATEWHLFGVRPEDGDDRDESCVDPHNLDLSGLEVFCNQEKGSTAASEADLAMLEIWEEKAEKMDLEIPPESTWKCPKTKSRRKDPRKYEPWSDLEDRELQALHRQGKTKRELAFHFLRQATAIQARLRKLKLIPALKQNRGN